MNILVSGASGFVGKALCIFLQKAGHAVTQIDRHSPLTNLRTDISYDCLVSLAGRAHVMLETAENVYQAYADININYTIKMAQLAKDLGIKRFIFLSSVKVNGESTETPFTPEDKPAPLDAYGKSKLEAEIALKGFCATNSLEWVIIRPPLIYGPGVKANFKSLIALCEKTVPLPFASINNKRSLISLENLNDFITLCCHHPSAANQIFLISDDHDVSTMTLIRTIKKSLGLSPLLLPFPPWLMKWIFTLLRKQNLSDRLLANLQVDITKAKQILGWQPIISFDEGIQRTVADYVD